MDDVDDVVLSELTDVRLNEFLIKFVDDVDVVNSKSVVLPLDVGVVAVAAHPPVTHVVTVVDKPPLKLFAVVIVVAVVVPVISVSDSKR